MAYTFVGNTRGSVHSTIRSVTGSASGTVLARQNSDRAGLVLMNRTDVEAFVALSGTCNYTNGFSFLLPSGSSWTAPLPIWSGPVTAQWGSSPGSGSMLITEMV